MNPHPSMMEFAEDHSSMTVLAAAAEEKIHKNLLFSPSLSPIALSIPPSNPSVLPRRGQRSQCPETHPWN